MADKSEQDNSSSASLPRGLLSRRGKVMPNARLPSLRAQRDLTLGGIQKKTFKPNIPVRKDRNKDTSKEGGSEASKDNSYNKKDRKHRERGRGRDRVHHEAVQSHSSIFEEGPADAMKRRWGGGGGGGGSNGASGGASQRRVIKKERDEESDARMMRELMCEDFIDDLDTKKDNMKYNPIQLPLKTTKIHQQQQEVKSEDKDIEQMDVDGLVIKDEPTEYASDQMEGLETSDLRSRFKAKHRPAKKPTQQITAASLFSNTNKLEGELLFFQLPDCLPGNNESEISKVHVKKEDEGKNQTEDNPGSRDNKCHLKHLPEGFIGKLQVLKSGRTRLVLGNVNLDVSMGAPCAFLQNLVAVQIEEDKTGSINSLGQVKHRVVCSPDFERLLTLGT